MTKKVWIKLSFRSWIDQKLFVNHKSTIIYMSVFFQTETVAKKWQLSNEHNELLLIIYLQSTRLLIKTAISK